VAYRFRFGVLAMVGVLALSRVLVIGSLALIDVAAQCGVGHPCIRSPYASGKGLVQIG
jgi:hypothetical protein